MTFIFMSSAANGVPSGATVWTAADPAEPPGARACRRTPCRTRSRPSRPARKRDAPLPGLDEPHAGQVVDRRPRQPPASWRWSRSSAARRRDRVARERAAAPGRAGTVRALSLRLLCGTRTTAWTPSSRARARINPRDVRGRRPCLTARTNASARPVVASAWITRPSGAQLVAYRGGPQERHRTSAVVSGVAGGERREDRAQAAARRRGRRARPGAASLSGRRPAL